MSKNLFVMLKELLPSPPLLVGNVQSIANGTALIMVPGGAIMQARGVATVGQDVFFRNNFIESAAPGLLLEIIEV